MALNMQAAQIEIISELSEIIQPFSQSNCISIDDQ